MQRREVSGEAVGRSFLHYASLAARISLQLPAVSVVIDRLSYKWITAVGERDRVSRFWQEQFRETAPYLCERPSEATWHATSRVFAGYDGDQVVVACRLSPFHPELGWEASAELGHDVLGRFEPSRLAQLSRVAVIPEARNRRAHERFFYELAKAVLQEHEFDSFFSIVRASMVRMYKPWGIRMVNDRPIRLESRNQRRFAIVRGNVAKTHELLGFAIGET